MTGQRTGPTPGETKGRSQTENVAAAKPLKPSASTLTTAGEVPVQLRRRRAGSLRLMALDDGRSDPLDLEHVEDLSPAALDGWALAIDHLLEVGLCPIVPVGVRLARRGAS